MLFRSLTIRCRNRRLRCQANVSKHLNLLFRHRMVSRRKEGLNVYYRIADPTIFELCELVCSSLEAELEASRKALARRRARA